MSRARPSWVMLSVTVSMLLLRASAPVAAADPDRAAAPPSALAGAVEASLSYQGRLTDAAGGPLSGSHDLVFQVWDDATGGSQVGPEAAHSGVSVVDGLFAVEIAVDPAGFDGGARWLRIGVDGEWLSPRQPLLAVPYALGLRPGAQIIGSAAVPSLTVGASDSTVPALRASGNAVGVNAVGATALVAQGQGIGIEAYGMTAVRGEGDVGVRGLGLTGVWGSSELGQGVKGTSAGAAGVYGESDGAYGVHGKSRMEHGVYGETSGGFAAGVGGSGPTGVFGMGGLVGVSGSTSANDTTAVLGTATGYGSTGVSGTAQFGTGVVGEGEVGVKGTGTVGVGVEGTGPTGVSGSSPIGDGVLGHTEGGGFSAGVHGTATYGYGGHFESANGAGVQAKGYEGIHAEATSNMGYGIHGIATGSAGVQGQGFPGVGGQSTTGYGVIAASEQNHSLFIPGAGGAAIRIDGATLAGVDVAAAGHEGVLVRQAGRSGMLVGSATWEGFEVTSAGYNGLYVASAGYDGVRIQNAGEDGVRIFEGVGRDYIRAGADGDPDFRVAKDGLVLTDRGYRCGDGAIGCLQTGAADVAERIDSSERLTPGDVVEIDPARPDHFRLARTALSTLVAGVISTRPGVVMGVDGRALDGDDSSDDRPALALVGRVPVKVTAAGGPIAIGDLLVASNVPGRAMRAVDPPAGTVIGKALGPLASGTGVILALIQAN
jgi:hypothetical protein